MNDYIELLGDLIVKMSPSIALIVPIVWTQLKQIKANSRDSKALMDSTKETYLQLINVANEQKEHKEITKFNLSLRSLIQTRVSQTISYSKLDPKYNTVLKKYQKLIEPMVFSYYYNKFRDIDYEMKDFLTVEFEDIKEEIKEKIRTTIFYVKRYKYSNGKICKISFYEYFTDEKNRTPFRALELFKLELEINGYDDKNKSESKNFMSSVDHHLKDILNSFCEDIIEWTKIIDIKEHD